MASSSGNNNGDRIQLGVKNTERLIRQKDYNSAMVKARQTLEFMVRMLAGRSGAMNDSDLKQMIDFLYQNRQISRTSCERYHKIRMIGNKAAHEGDNSASNANLAFQLLSQEMDVFVNEYQNRKGSRRSGDRSPGSRSSSRSSGSRDYRNGRRSPRRKRRNRFSPQDLLLLLIPVICIILIFFAVRMIKSKTDKEVPSDTVATTQAPPETPPRETVETMAPTVEEPTTEPPPAVYRTTDVLNVRSEPSAESSRLGKLNAGVTVEYVRAENEEWAVILYDGREAYVASQYLTTQ